MVEQIFREQTPEEKKNFTDLRKWRSTDIKQNALKRISEIEYDTTYKQRKPYCTKCAINEVDSQIALVNKSIEKARRQGKTSIKYDFAINYKQFSSEKLFDLVNTSEIVEDKLLDGIRQRVQTGIYKDYVCKICGSAQSMEIKNREMETKKTHLPESTKA